MTGKARIAHKGNRALQKLATLLMSLCLLCPTVSGFAESISSVSVEAAPLTTASSAVDGMVRVYLSSLGTPSTLTLTISGSYSLSTGVSLTSGETVTVGFSSSSGAITLTRNGVKTNMGTYFAFKRHSTTGTNGILIAQARKPSNPYPGDISFQSVQLSSGSYKLYTVAHVYIESYLYGVLPYEMGSSAPTEALKAQAVAARTYTVRMMSSRASGYYDVVDTTSDQVYNGTPSGNTTCEAAVNATKGIVLKYGSSYTATYYSASNGGQTESIANIWGTSGYSYLSVKDDPFDYANPNSTVKKATVYASCSSSSNNSSLMALLKTKAVSALSSAGYSATSSNTTLGTITAIVAHTPKYSSPSRLYTKMDFTLTATTLNSAGATVTATTTVTCGIFTELESLLSMSIQSSTNELWSVTQSGSTFTLSARRYGHGLGMSQRGAMYMGTLGYSYAEILGFYFTGSTRVGCTFTNTILASGSTEEITTEEESASVEDSSSSTSATGIVSLVSGGSLAIRASKSTTGKLLGVAPNSSPVTVYANDGTWCLIGLGSLVGYVTTNALTITGTAPTTSSETVSEIIGFATVTASTYLNLRASGSTSATVLTTAPNGAVMTVFSKTSSWAHVQYGATAAYASTDFLSISETYPSTVVNTGSTTATVSVGSGSTAALRASASTTGTVLTQISDGITVTVSSDDGSWAYVTYSGTSGYMLSASLVYADDTTTNDDTEDGGDTDDSEETLNDGERYATVTAATAYLRVSADESSTMILEIAMGQSVVVTSEDATWCAVRYEGVTGYILAASLSAKQSSDTTTSVTATVATPGGSLNLRQLASAGSTILTVIPQGASVTVTSRGSTWCAVTYAGVSGYVMTTYLQFADDTSTSDSVTVNTTATVVTTSGSLNLRQQPKAGSTILTTIPRLAVVSVQTKGSEWCGVTYGTTAGYVMTAFLSFTATDSQDTATDSEETVDNGDSTDSDETDSDTTDDAEDSQEDTSDVITAIVTTASGSLNLRADILPGSRILTRIPKGTTITVEQKYSTWTQTTYLGYTGYVMNSYLTFSSATVVTDTASSATVITVSGSLNLRTEPYGTVVATIPQSATVAVITRGSTWCYLLYNGVYGYAMTAYLSFNDTSTAVTTTDSSTEDTTGTTNTATSSTDETTDTADTASSTSTDTTDSTDTASSDTLTATVVTTSGSLNLRDSASTTGSVIATIPRLATVTVLVKESEWCHVQYAGYQGYVMTKYLTFVYSTTTTDSSNSGSTSTATTASASNSVAWVYTPSGSLNLRQSASSSAKVLYILPRLTKITLLSQGATWCQVQYGDIVGYVMTCYISLTEPTELAASTASTQTTDNTATDTSDTTTNSSTDTGAATTTTVAEDSTLVAPATTLYATVTPIATASTLPLWEACTESDGWLLEMIKDTQVQVLRKGDTWCEVTYYNQTGFCLTKGLTILAQ